MLNTEEYISLLTKFPPRVISNDEELEETIKVVDELTDKEELSGAENSYLNLLALVIEDYESSQELVGDISGFRLFRQLIKEGGWKNIGKVIRLPISVWFKGK